MIGFFVGLGTFLLILLCGWLVLLILMQRPSANAGMGAALGGGVAESAFGGEASTVLTRWTVYGIVAFFLGTLVLSLTQMSRRGTLNEGKLLAPMVVKETPKGSLTKLDGTKEEGPKQENAAAE